MIMKPTVIAFLGRAGSGKTTAAEHLVENYGAVKFSFAAPLKELARHLFEFSEEQVYGSQEVKETVDSRYGFTPRSAMQRLGNGAREVLGKRVWVDACFSTILSHFVANPSDDLFVIDDCRYLNEAGLISTEGGFAGHVVKLVCPDAKTSVDPTHPSEAEVDQVPPEFISCVISCNRSPDSRLLLARVDEFMQSLNIK